MLSASSRAGITTEISGIWRGSIVRDKCKARSTSRGQIPKGSAPAAVQNAAEPAAVLAVLLSPRDVQARLGEVEAQAHLVQVLAARRLQLLLGLRPIAL